MIPRTIKILGDISIHAPAKGATVLTGSCQIRVHNFNPRSREGSDPSVRFRNLKAFRFQSTLPRRERLNSNSTPNPCTKFQSTLPRRERLRAFLQSRNPHTFQSTLPRRERHNSNWCRCSYINFNPRSREGSDVDSKTGVCGKDHFNPRSREGSDNSLNLFTLLL